MIAEKLLGMNKGAAAIGIDAAQIKGVLRLPLSSLHATLPVFKNPANKHKRYPSPPSSSAPASATPSPRRNPTSSSRNGRPLSRTATLRGRGGQPSPHSPDKVDTDNPDRGPLLLTMGGKDHTVPEAITKSTLKQYRHSPAKTNLVEFEDRGHSLTIDRGWSEVAEACVAWLDEQGL